MDKKHTKHTNLVKPKGGKFHRNEYAILGASCEIIDEFASKLSAGLHQLKVGYINQLHNAESNDFGFTQFTDKLESISIDSKTKLYQVQQKKYFEALDLLFINGNHFLGEKQILIIHESKRVSLSKKIDRLTDVKMIISERIDTPLHDYLSDLSSSIPRYTFEDFTGICDHIFSAYKEEIPLLNGLVLVGGISQRMGEDKALITYRNQPHAEFTKQCLSAFCDKVYYSESDKKEINLNGEKIIDKFIGLGPYGGILSAFRYNPNCAWLTVSCDLPLMDTTLINQLVKKRNPQKVATCYYNPDTEFPEPLITIWEPRAYPVLLQFLSNGYSCPRKVLINADIELVKLLNKDSIFNANTKEQFKVAKEKLNNKLN